MSTVELTAPTLTIESAAKESASVKTPIGGRSVTRVAIARKPEGVWTAGGRHEGDVDYRLDGQEHCAFFNLILRKVVTVDEGHDFAKMVAEEVEVTSWRLRETIRVRELAATHRLEQMRRLLMLEEQKAWKREAGFDYIETAAEMDARDFFVQKNAQSE